MSPYHASTGAAGVVGIGQHADAGEQSRLLVERFAEIVVQIARVASASGRRLPPRLPPPASGHGAYADAR